MPTAAELPTSPRANVTLKPKVVRPPQLDERNNHPVRVPFRGRANSARPRPIKPVSEQMRAAATTARRGIRPAPPQEPKRVAVAETRAAESDGIRTAVAAQREAASASVLEPRDLHLPPVSSWPTECGTRLLADVERLLVAADRHENPVLRADAVLEAVVALSAALPTYRNVLETLATEVRLLSTKLDDATDEAVAARAQAAETERQCGDTLTAQAAEFDAERKRWQQTRDSRDDELEEAIRDLHTMRRRLAEQSAELDSVRRANEEAIKARISFEAMATQFATRNNSMSDKIAQLERELEASQRRADQAMASNYQYSQRVLSLEQSASGDSESHRQALAKLNHAVQDANARLRTCQGQVIALRDQVSRAEKERDEAVTERNDALSRVDSVTAAATPRPAFHDRDEAYYGQLSSTSHRYDAISEALERTRLRMVEATSELDQLARAAHLGTATSSSLRPLAGKVPAIVYTPPMTRVGGRVAPWLVSASPAVRVPSVPFREAVQLVRSTFAAVTDFERRLVTGSSGGGATSLSPPFIEMHAMLHWMSQDKFPVAATATETSFRAYHVASSWSNVPLMRLFAAVLREELAPWVFHAQNRFITNTMRALSAISGSTAAETKALLAAMLRAEAGFTDADIAVVSGHLLALYSGSRDPTSETSFKSVLQKAEASQLAASGRGRQAFADAGEDVVLDENEVCCRVDFDEFRHNPASQATQVEIPMVTVLRRVHLERLSMFYHLLDREVSWQATGKQRPPAAQLAGASIRQPQVVLAVENVLPGLPQADAVAFVAKVFALCHSVVAYDKQVSKLAKKELDTPTASSLPNRLLPLAGLTRWFTPFFLEYPRPKALVPDAVANVTGKASSGGGLAGQSSRSMTRGSSSRDAGSAKRSQRDLDAKVEAAKDAVRTQLVGQATAVGTLEDFMADSSDADEGADGVKSTGDDPFVDIATLDPAEADSDSDSSSASGSERGAPAVPLGRRSSMSAMTASAGSPKLLASASGAPRRKSVVVFDAATSSSLHGSPNRSQKRTDKGHPVVLVLRCLRKVEFIPSGQPTL